jgi:hypothetical protein
LLKIIKIILTVIATALLDYVLLSKNFALIPFMMLFVGALMLVTRLVEIQKDRKEFLGYLNIIGSIFIFFVSIQLFLIEQ